MTVTLSYDNSRARVAITADGLGSATHAKVERSVDQIVWMTVRGGVAVDVDSGEFLEPLYDYEFRAGFVNYYRVTDDPEVVGPQTAHITPHLDRIWLKSVMRSFLSRPYVFVWPSAGEVARPARGATLEVVGRTLPIGIAQPGGSRRFSIVVRTETVAETRTLDYLIASGDIVFVHTPRDCPIPTMYARMDAATARRTRPRGTAVHTEIPLVEVAAPGPDVVPASQTWDSLIGALDWDSEVITRYATWDELAALVGDPGEVIVP